MRARRLASVSRPPHALLAAALAIGIALGASACGTGGLSTGGDIARGKDLFTAKCAACHTLADAGTAGVVGPNLDDSFAAGRKQGFRESTIQQVVADQIRFAACVEPATGEVVAKDPLVAKLVKEGNCMPRNLVRGDDLDAVAGYVASVAGKPVQGGGGGGAITATTGKDIFQQAGCASCHTLADAGSTGTIGPNLDQKKPPKSLAVDRVTNGKGAMPSFKGKLTPAQIQAVAKYVSSVAGK